MITQTVTENDITNLLLPKKKAELLAAEFLKNYPKFCKTDIFKITQEQIQVIINDQAAHFSPKTVRNRYGFISSVLKMYRPDVYLSISLPQKIRPEIHIPTDEDIKKLINAVRGTELEIPVMLAAFGTMREGEICALTLDDLQGNIIHVNKSRVRTFEDEFVDKAPKTYSSDRFIEIPEFLADRIHEKGYITTYKPNSILKALTRVLDRNGIVRFRFHDLRHYSASVLHALNIPDVYIMQRGGWNTESEKPAFSRHLNTFHEGSSPFSCIV